MLGLRLDALFLGLLVALPLLAWLQPPWYAHVSISMASYMLTSIYVSRKP